MNAEMQTRNTAADLAGRIEVHGRTCAVYLDRAVDGTSVTPERLRRALDKQPLGAMGGRHQDARALRAIALALEADL
ncbi:hypothetical protein KBTX_02784 [wastewater metagenome]|uniref:Uncharacterized protein n=2 Tax=unclassified sequences TaxID=12908 RepID=A0A5B8RCR2_9ZZZZ|nr:hypothetical protein [Arhodomonas sp. KWT]QEA06446.1 hypothetical protein KBTEX_02784 [uncultured organism]